MNLYYAFSRLCKVLIYSLCLLSNFSAIAGSAKEYRVIEIAYSGIAWPDIDTWHNSPEEACRKNGQAFVDYNYSYWASHPEVGQHTMSAQFDRPDGNTYFCWIILDSVPTFPFAIESRDIFTNDFELKVRPSTPIIPDGSTVSKGRVLTLSSLTLNVSRSGIPYAGALVTLQSNRGTIDKIDQPTQVTNNAGNTLATVSTRDQSSPSTITSASSAIQTSEPGVIRWLPARYESSFLVTCYVISQEADYSSSDLIGPVNGLPKDKKYREDFISDVAMQGSGMSTDGKIIHYDGNGQYSSQTCAVTASGKCAIDKSTIAVDRKIIPMNSRVAIETVGERTARDTGGGIKGYHIDEYYGTRRDECTTAGRRNLTVNLQSY